jgi:hypothetical protein
MSGVLGDVPVQHIECMVDGVKVGYLFEESISIIACGSVRKVSKRGISSANILDACSACLVV